MVHFMISSFICTYEYMYVSKYKNIWFDVIAVIRDHFACFMAVHLIVQYPSAHIAACFKKTSYMYNKYVCIHIITSRYAYEFIFSTFLIFMYFFIFNIFIFYYNPIKGIIFKFKNISIINYIIFFKQKTLQSHICMFEMYYTYNRNYIFIYFFITQFIKASIQKVKIISR